MRLVVEGRAAGDDRVLVRRELLDDLGRARRRGDHRLRLVAEPQAQQRLIEGFRLAPGGEFVAPQFHVLLAPEPVGLLGGKHQADGAVRPFEPRGAGEEAGPFVPPAAVEDARFAKHHRVADVGCGRPDEVDDRVGLDPPAHRLGAGARLARAAPGEDQPDDPVARRRRLIGARPERPVMKQLGAFERRHLRDDPRALAGFEPEEVADMRDPHAGREGGARPADARPRFGLSRSGVHSLGLSAPGPSRTTTALSLSKSRPRSSSP